MHTYHEKTFWYGAEHAEHKTETTTKKTTMFGKKVLLIKYIGNREK